MRKLLLTAILVMCSVLFTNAQSTLGPITITHGKEIEKTNGKIVRIAGEANGKVYTLATKGKKYFIKVFDSSGMALESTNEIKLPDFKGKEIDFEEIKVLNDRIYILGSIYSRKEKISRLFAMEVSASGKITSNKKKIFSIKVTKKKERGAFYFKKSPDGSKLLILHAALFDKQEKIQYEVKLLDENLNVLMSNLKTVPFKDRRGLEFTIADFDVNFKNDVFLVVNESYRNKKTKKNIEKFQVHLFKAENEYKREIVKINLSNKEIINCQMLANSKNKIQLVGFYSSVRKNGKANKELKGVYAIVIDPVASKVSSLKFNEFDYKTKVKLLGERRAKKGKDLKPLYVPHTLIEKEDGGFLLLSELAYIIEKKGGGIGPLAATAIVYVKNEMIVTSLNPDGSIAWTNVLAKEQKAAFTAYSLNLTFSSGGGGLTVGGGLSIPLGIAGKGPEYLSVLPIYEKGDLTIVFNDNVKNIGITDIEEIRPLGNFNKAVPTAFKFDKVTGDITRVDSEGNKKNQLILRPGVYYRVTPTEYIIYSSRKSKDKLGRMTI